MSYKKGQLIRLKSIDEIKKITEHTSMKHSRAILYDRVRWISIQPTMEKYFDKLHFIAYEVSQDQYTLESASGWTFHKDWLEPIDSKMAKVLYEKI